MHRRFLAMTLAHLICSANALKSREQSKNYPTPITTSKRKTLVKKISAFLRCLGLTIVFVFFAFGGAGHFTSTEFFVAIMPPYLPFHLAAVYISGAFEIVGALGLLHSKTRRSAGIGLFVLTIAVTPVNIYMWMTPAAFPDVPESFLTLRLVAQVLLLMCIWWSTKPVVDLTDESTEAPAV
jgi:uncharacterized membrane protein